MPLPDENTGGGGSTDICAISPSDMAGQIDNILSRLEALENAVAQMLGGNITAGQLSDISEQVGWVYGVTYMGTTGWTQTQYGTLIPPAGWSLSSLGLLDYAGNPYQNMVLDSDGVLQWSVDSDAHIGGAKPEFWDQGGNLGTMDYGIAWNTGSGNNSNLRNVSVVHGGTSYIEFTVTNGGLWQVNAHLMANDNDTATDGSLLIKQSSLDPATTTNGLHMRALLEYPSSAAHAVPLTLSGLVNLADGESVRAYFSGAGGTTSGGIHFHIVRLSS